MKRTVKAWVVIGPKGGCRSVWRGCNPYYRDMVPCVVTYDDGQPKAKPRRKAKRAGRGK